MTTAPEGSDFAVNQPVLGELTERALARFYRARDRRIKRYLNFDKFRDHAAARIHTLASENEQIAYFLSYGFYVLEGGKTAGWDDSVVKVQFGSRPYLTAYGEPQLVCGEISRSLRSFAEQGASLLYQRGDDGHVMCLLYPASSERESKTVSMVVLKVVNDPSDLLNDRLLRSHLKSLAAYMAATSLDGSPTMLQRCRHWWLHLAKRRTIGGVVRPPQMQVIAGKLLLWVTTVAFSGFALFLMQRWWPEKDAVSPAVLQASQAAQRKSAEQLRVLEQIRDTMAASAATRASPSAQAKAPSPAAPAKNGK
ncbi:MULTISPECIES: hypothetical protein [Xanthomonas]|uniref:hypothetical protein n=1 Tax=Xanthomonas TaxID=338 RepID=UPI0023683901|nr:hypothetical protein [Xanthomonas campestris]MEB1409562.1 hypothetical protein [Xanthomonas campestris pv. campestris]MEB1510806.1 hypothetical protein [Xanthomonas campestris pv. campestris]MEB1763574.1 hypothetical protein [Xanthomonas campestris pv. campestris]MEB1874084.1 hypothetical protein [Xanthomonas campestris pv. campestris]MEB1909852.1 hypothetical protein [Xanthomonas campestris pv. campestris]